MNRDRIVGEFGLKRFGSKGWLTSSTLYCPVCGKSDKIGILFTNKGGVVHCFHENHYKESLKQYLMKVGRQDLIEEYNAPVSIYRNIPSLFEEVEKEELAELPEKRLPIGFKQIDSHSYLDEERGFLPYHYKLFKPGVTKIDPRQLGNIIFQVFDERDVRVAWLSRSTKSKEWHKINLERFKEDEVDLKLRYDNSPNTDFGKMLGGVPEITSNTHTVIIVEGLFDKTNVDIQLRLDLEEGVKCLFSFGDNLTIDQVNILKKFSNIDNVYLMYDYKTIEQSKQCGAMIEEETNCTVRVGEIKEEGKDPGNMTCEEIISVMDQSVFPLSFKVGKLNYV